MVQVGLFVEIPVDVAIVEKLPAVSLILRTCFSVSAHNLRSLRMGKLLRIGLVAASRVALEIEPYPRRSSATYSATVFIDTTAFHKRRLSFGLLRKSS